LKPEPRIDEHLGRRLRLRRRQLGLTQGQLAEGDGVQFQQIQKYECGASAISAARLWRLSKSLDVPVNYFFHGLTPAAPDRRAAPSARERAETAELLRAVAGLQETERRRLLDLMRAMKREPDGAAV
jgi:transcriptional regulator with XRE-family HTH domain